VHQVIELHVIRVIPIFLRSLSKTRQLAVFHVSGCYRRSQVEVMTIAPSRMVEAGLSPRFDVRRTRI
jgi:hypothetical protein